jgi:hypothetical protein
VCRFFRAKDRLQKFWSELQIHVTQLEREGSPPPGVRLSQAKLSQNSNQLARGRIRQFESYMASHAVARFFVNTVGTHTGSSTPSPTNQR